MCGEQLAPEQQQGEAPQLPSQWRSALDERGRTYYYHVKLRQPQWLPPAPHDAAGRGSLCTPIYFLYFLSILCIIMGLVQL